MTKAEWERLTAAFTRKHLRIVTWPDTVSEETLKGIIATVIIDTELVLSGRLHVEDFER